MDMVYCRFAAFMGCALFIVVYMVYGLRLFMGFIAAGVA
jgi:hypothetical protein